MTKKHQADSNSSSTVHKHDTKSTDTYNLTKHINRHCVTLCPTNIIPLYDLSYIKRYLIGLLAHVTGKQNGMSPGE